MKEALAQYVISFLYQIAALDTRVVLLIVLIVMSVIVLDAVFAETEKTGRETGMTPGAVMVSIDGTKGREVKNYVSEKQGLAGRPDAVVQENGFIIPVERKPLAKKLRDRYVAQLLVYMRLIEEFEGKRPPYGYLILGPNCKRVRIDNTEERQAWLQKMIDEMQEILAGGECEPTPHPRKCEKCHVREACQFRVGVEGEAPSQAIRSKSRSLSRSAG